MVRECRPPWPEERTERLRKLVREGLTATEIGVKLNVTKNAVIGKIHREGISECWTGRTFNNSKNPNMSEMAKKRIAEGREKRAMDAKIVRDFVAETCKKKITVTSAVDILAIRHGIRRSKKTLQNIATELGVLFYVTSFRYEKSSMSEKERADIAEVSAFRQKERNKSIEERYGPPPDPIGGRDPHNCRYIIGDPKGEWRYCSHEIMPGIRALYCAHHYRKCYSEASKLSLTHGAV